MVMLIMALSSAIFISPVAAQINVSIGDAEAYQDTTTTVQIIAHNVTDLGAFGLSPDTTMISGPTGETVGNDVTFAWTGSDDVTPTAQLVYSYRLDGSWSAWTSDTSKTYDDLSNGDYTFSVIAKDQADKESTPAERSFTVSVTRRRGGGGGIPRDSDNDGYSDIDEMLAGTDPNDPNSYPDASTPTLPPKVTPTPTPTPAPTPPVKQPTKIPWGLIIGIIVAVIIVGAAAYYFYTKNLTLRVL